MKKVVAFAMMLTAVAGLAFATPIHPKDLRWDCKTQFIQLQNQSGWDYCTEIQPVVKKAAAPKPAEPVKKVQAPAPVAPEAPKEVPAPKQEAKVVPQKEWILKGVQFETNSDRLQPSSMVVLNEAADVLKENGNVKVEIQGHTDSIGNDQLNQSLSQRRAEAVKVYLTQKGIAASRLATKGYGETKPIADNQVASGRADNRRIEFKVLER